MKSVKMNLVTAVSSMESTITEASNRMASSATAMPTMLSAQLSGALDSVIREGFNSTFEVRHFGFCTPLACSSHGPYLALRAICFLGSSERHRRCSRTCTLPSAKAWSSFKSRWQLNYLSTRRRRQAPSLSPWQRLRQLWTARSQRLRKLLLRLCARLGELHHQQCALKQCAAQHVMVDLLLSAWLTDLLDWWPSSGRRLRLVSLKLPLLGRWERQDLTS